MNTAACAELRLGNHTPSEAFSDPRVVVLTKAAIKGDRERVAQLAREGVPLNVVGAEDATPLMWALYANNLVGMEALLQAGADPNQRAVKGWSPLTWAAGGDKPEMLALLLRYGGNPNSDDTGKIDDRPLSVAARQGRLENVKLLVGAGSDVNAHDDYGHSAPNYAITITGNYEIAAYLLEHGYTHDLQALAATVEIRHVSPDSDRRRWKDKVIEMLKARGVTFPAFIPCRPPGDPRRNEEDCKKSKGLSTR